MAPGEGSGLVAFDPEPPGAVETFTRPEWTAGDRMVFLRGGEQSMALRVEEVTDDTYVLVDEESGASLVRDKNLANLCEKVPDVEGPVRVLAPADIRFHWPLWVGKRWRCNLLDKTLGGAAWPLEIRYHVEGMDEVVVPAGRFRALRIHRRMAVQTEGRFLERESVIWYSPDIGLEVRQIVDGTPVELVEWSRGNPGSEGAGR